MTVSVAFESVTKILGQCKAVDHLTLDIAGGELFFLLGPSGCGKTTALRSVAGFYTPEEGRILFNGKDQSRVPPHKRNTGMVFQNYALWPHMDVQSNVAYGLKMRRVSDTEKQQRVRHALEIVQMQAFAERMPNQLSGGQQQRVALARALVIEPDVVLLDEPLSNLDAKLRVDMRTQIKEIHRKIGRTMIYVTHDQAEALSMADRIAVMRRGRVVQAGTPRELYNRPRLGVCRPIHRRHESITRNAGRGGRPANGKNSSRPRACEKRRQGNRPRSAGFVLGAAGISAPDFHPGIKRQTSRRCHQRVDRRGTEASCTSATTNNISLRLAGRLGGARRGI